MGVRPYDPADYELGKRVEYDYHPNIPDFAKGSPMVWRRSAHVGGLIALSGIWDYKNVPTKFRGRMCFGTASFDGEEHDGFTRIRGTVCCASCERPKAYLSRWCLNCGEFYIQDFLDTRYCPCYPHCWDCLSELPWSYCPDHATPNQVDFFESTGKTVMSPPAGFNPLKISDEELEDFIKNELGI